MSFTAIRGCPVVKSGFVQFSGSFAIKKPPSLAAIEFIAVVFSPLVGRLNLAEIAEDSFYHHPADYASNCKLYNCLYHCYHLYVYYIRCIAHLQGGSMKKRIISLFLVLAVSLSMFCPLAFADDSSTHEHDWSSGIISEFSDTVEGIPVSVSVKKCTKCNFYKHTYKFFGLSFDFYNVTAYTGIVDDFLLDVTLHISSALGKNATAKKYETGGGSAGTGGAGRNPSGYVNSNKGIPSVSSDGSYTLEAKYYVSNTSNITFTGTFVPLEWSKNGDDYDFTATADGITFENRSGNNNLQVPFYGSYWVDVSALKGGYVYIPKGSLIRDEGNYVKATEDSVWREAALTVRTMSFNDNDKVLNFFYKGLFYSYSSPTTFHGNNQSVSYVVMKSDKKYSFDYPVLYLRYVPYDGALKNQTNITINNNTWNGNIYQDNSTNLTYIYPQYTTVNENNETVTNISNTPIIYNNETKQYYTYDQTTKNYYYITYNAQPTPSQKS